MKGAQAQQGYGRMDNNCENHYGKDIYKSRNPMIVVVSVKKINCNNIISFGMSLNHIWTPCAISFSVFPSLWSSIIFFPFQIYIKLEISLR